MNWPGAEIILSRLKSFNKTSLLVMAVVRSVKIALVLDAQAWLLNMSDLLDNKVLTANLPKYIYRVLIRRNACG